MIEMRSDYYEAIDIYSQYFGYQSWYFGYVLAILLVVLVFWICKISGKKHFIIWLPTLFMIVISAIIYLLYIKFIDFAIENSTIDQYHGTVNERLMVEYYASKHIAVAGLRRWVDAAWRYTVCSAVLSASGYVILRGVKIGKRKITLICTCVLAALSALCAADRSLAISAKIIFEARGGAIEQELSWLHLWDESEDKMLSQSLAWLGGPDKQETQLRVLKTDVPVYANINEREDPICYLPAGLEIQQFELRLIGTSHHEGWKYTSKQFKAKAEWTDEDGYKRMLCEGYLRIDDLLKAIEPSKGYSNPKLTARFELMETDILAFSKNFALSPSIMHAFMPLELYVLCPSAVLLFIAWLWMLIKDIKQKKTAV